MSYPLRLPPNLEAAARERAAGIGISFNAFICVCVDAYLNGSAKPAIEAAPQSLPAREVPRAATQSEQRRAKRNEAEFLAVEREAFNDDDAGGQQDDSNWRFFDPDPDLWPLVDPDPQWSKRRDEILEKYGDATESGTKALDREYWSTRQRPAYEQPGATPRAEAKRTKSRKGPG